MPFQPDTPENRALFRAVRDKDEGATADALARGADPNAGWGRGKATGNITCSALLRALDFQEESPKSTEVAALLLAAGAHPWKSPHAIGRSPLELVLRRGHGGAVNAFVQSAGGEDAFLAAVQADRQSYRLLGSLLDSGLGHPELRALLFKAIERIPSSLWPSGSSMTTGLSWPWDRLPSQRVDMAVVARLEKRAPRPRPVDMGQKGWMQWMRSAINGYGRGELFRQVCKATPASWWLEDLPPVSVNGNTACRFNKCLLTTLAKAHSLEGLKIAMAAIASHPEEKKKLDGMAPELLLAAAGAGSSPVFRLFVKATGQQNLEKKQVSELALVLCGSTYDPHHRLTLMQSFLEMGVNLEARLEPEGETLLEKALAWPDRQRIALIDQWTEQGLDWSVQDDQGVSRLSKLAKVAPQRAAQWRQDHLETSLLEPLVPRRAGLRL